MNLPSVSGVSVAPNLYASQIRPDAAVTEKPAPAPPPAAELTSAVAPPEKNVASSLTPNYRVDGEPTDPDDIGGPTAFDEVV
jgi:hypothetical protein